MWSWVVIMPLDLSVQGSRFESPWDDERCCGILFSGEEAERLLMIMTYAITDIHVFLSD